MEDIVKSNRVIAEFLELPTVKAQPLRGGEYDTLYNIQSLPKIYIPVGGHGINATIQTGLLIARGEQLCFHSNYDWLMSAWVKCREILDPLKHKDPYQNHYNSISYAILNYEIHIVADRIARFITWYNQTK